MNLLLSNPSSPGHITKDSMSYDIVIPDYPCWLLLCSHNYVPNARKTAFVKETLLKLKSYSKPCRLIVGDLNLTLSTIGRSLRQKLRGEITSQTEVMIQINLTNMYKTFNPNTKEYTFFSTPHKTYSKTDHISSPKVNLNK